MTQEMNISDGREQDFGEYNRLDIDVQKQLGEMVDFVIAIKNKGRDENQNYQLDDDEVRTAHDYAVTVLALLRLHKAYSELQRSRFLHFGGPNYIALLSEAIEYENMGRATRTNTFAGLSSLTDAIFYHKFL